MANDLTTMEATVRKQVFELTADDLRRCPIWEFALDEEGDDGHDEATVRPAQSSDVEEKLDGSLIVSARFELADGTRLPGYVTARGIDANTIGDLQPQIVTERGQVMFWYGRCPLQTAHAYDILNRDPQSVFPIRFKTDMPIDGTECVGEIPGFLCLNDDFESVTIVR